MLRRCLSSVCDGQDFTLWLLHNHFLEWGLYILYFMGAEHLATRVRMSKWLLRQWLHKGRNLHFAWAMIFHWQFYLRDHICFMTISSNGLHRSVNFITCLIEFGSCLPILPMLTISAFVIWAVLIILYVNFLMIDPNKHLSLTLIIYI